MYNIDAPQRNLYKKDFKAHIEIRNYSCYTELNTSGYHVYLNDGNGNYDLIHEGASYNQSVGSYVIGNNTFYGARNRYIINPMKTSCNKFGKGSLETGVGVSFDNTGALTKTIADDECYVYLDHNPTPIYVTSDIISSAGMNSGSGQIVNENGYRYEGADPYNYICLGTVASPCPSDNLYRIIGAFNEYNNSFGAMQQSYVTKVIKNTNYGNTTYYWNSNTSNNIYSYITNTSSGGNYIYNTLNITIYNSLSSSLQKQIATTRWYFYMDKNSWIYGSNTTQIYENERGAGLCNGSPSGCYANFNIGLISVSDFKYATLASQVARTDHSNNIYANQNWIAKSIGDSIGNQTDRGAWTINPVTSSNYGGPYRIRHNSNSNWNQLEFYERYANNQEYVFPVFYLKNQGFFSKGAGTISNPYYYILDEFYD